LRVSEDGAEKKREKNKQKNLFYEIVYELIINFKTICYHTHHAMFEAKYRTKRFFLLFSTLHRKARAKQV
jgi:hypothetical protein